MCGADCWVDLLRGKPPPRASVIRALGGGPPIHPRGREGCPPTAAQMVGREELQLPFTGEEMGIEVPGTVT